MPYADPEMKKKQMKRWRKEKIAEGYGKWIYNRRKLRFDDEVRFRNALERIQDVCDSIHVTDEEARLEVLTISQGALVESRIAEQELGEFQASD